MTIVDILDDVCNEPKLLGGIVNQYWMDDFDGLVPK